MQVGDLEDMTIGKIETEKKEKGQKGQKGRKEGRKEGGKK